MILEQLMNEWLAMNEEHIPYKTPREIEREYNNNLVFAARLQEQLGRKLSDREIYDLTM